MKTDPSDEDAEAIGHTLRRFAREHVAPVVARPEERVDPTAVEALTREACDLGLLNLEAEDGCGLWEMAEQPGARRSTLRSLRELACTNAGIALHFHQLALGAWLARKLGVCDGAPSSVDLLGGYGMGRALLPRVLRGGSLDRDESAWLAAYFEPDESCPRLLQLGPPTAAVLFARYDASAQSLGFQRVATDALACERIGDSHGLDETQTVVVRALPTWAEPLRMPGDEHGVELYRSALELHSLGLCAISVGIQQHSAARAADYAELRRQGGVPIIRHAAVQTLLGRTHTAAASGHALLVGLGESALRRGSLTRSLAARASLLVEACSAANDALQVFGGSGYMRDTGVEKLVRDQNHLRVFWGSPRELRRFVTELERAS